MSLQGEQPRVSVNSLKERSYSDYLTYLARQRLVYRRATDVIFHILLNYRFDAINRVALYPPAI